MFSIARVAELADALDLGSSAAGHESSNLSPRNSFSRSNGLASESEKPVNPQFCLPFTFFYISTTFVTAQGCTYHLFSLPVLTVRLFLLSQIIIPATVSPCREIIPLCQYLGRLFKVQIMSGLFFLLFYFVVIASPGDLQVFLTHYWRCATL